MVKLIATAPAKVEDAHPPPPPAKVRALEPTQPRPLLVEAPVTGPGEVTTPASPPILSIEAPPAPPPPKAAGPVSLEAELAVACQERPPPDYPSISRRLGEQGEVLLRAELDENGRVFAAQVIKGSGYPRLDEAALGAVRHWHCMPVMRNGQSVHAVALQPFKFTLQGR